MQYKQLRYLIDIKSTEPTVQYTIPVAYTNDLNSAELIFELTDTTTEDLGVSPSAQILLYMADGSMFENPVLAPDPNPSTVTIDTAGTNPVIRMRIPENQGNHRGIHTAQVVLKVGADEWASQKVKFKIDSGLGDIALVEIVIPTMNAKMAEVDAKMAEVDAKLSLADNRIAELEGIDEAEELRIAADSARSAGFNAKITEVDDKLIAVDDTMATYALAETGRQATISNFNIDHQITHYDPVLGEYVGLRHYWDSLRTGKIYTVEFNKFATSPSPLGTKKDDNAGLTIVPSTNILAGQDDYKRIGLFRSIDVNAYVDANGDYHVTAIVGDSRFKRDGTNGDVYVMAMVGYQKMFSTATTWGVSYSDARHPGYEILSEAVKLNGQVRPYLLHAKYVAGINPIGGKLASISGVSPEWAGMSHDGQIDKFKLKGTQYSGKTSHDDYYVQLMAWLKYATTSFSQVMAGCVSYSAQYKNLVPEIGVKRIILTNAQANYFVVGSTVSIGDYGAGTISADQGAAQNYNLADRVKILSITDLGDGNSAVNVNSLAPFNTSLTTTILPYPWISGGCDNLLGTDGSPSNPTLGKEPFCINGIERMVGGYEILQNLMIYNNNTDPLNYKIQLYACYDCTKYNKSAHNANYSLVNKELVKTGSAWMYLSEIAFDPLHPSIPVPVNAAASSTTGFGDGVYTNAPVTGYREWRSLGRLSNGPAYPGLRSLNAYDALTSSSWYILGRLSATGQTGGLSGVN